MIKHDDQFYCIAVFSNLFKQRVKIDLVKGTLLEVQVNKELVKLGFRYDHRIRHTLIGNGVLSEVICIATDINSGGVAATGNNIMDCVRKIKNKTKDHGYEETLSKNHRYIELVKAVDETKNQAKVLEEIIMNGSSNVKPNGLLSELYGFKPHTIIYDEVLNSDK